MKPRQSAASNSHRRLPQYCVSQLCGVSVFHCRNLNLAPHAMEPSTTHCLPQRSADSPLLTPGPPAPGVFTLPPEILAKLRGASLKPFGFPRPRAGANPLEISPHIPG